MMDDDSSLNGSMGGGGYWIQNLYLLQANAPKPRAVHCPPTTDAKRMPTPRPAFYTSEYHGLIERAEAEKLLREAGEGSYLVRASRRSPNAYTLCILFDGNVLNYKLFYDGAHFVAEKRFDTLDCLVADGLIHMYVERHAGDYIKQMAEQAIYEDSPYSQFNRGQQSIGAATTDSTNNTTTATEQGSPKSKPRCHNFAPHTFKIPHYCDLCRNFMWGIVQQGVRCADCGFSAHKRCSEKARHDCRPDAKYLKRVFAVDLTTICMAHSVNVPPVLLACIEEVERRGLNVEGIYRVSGSFEQIDRLRRQFDLQPAAGVELSQVEDIHTVAGLLKLYLRLLPQQLVPYTTFRSLLSAFTTYKNSPTDKSRECRKALEELNDANMQTLRVLLAHLRLVADSAAENKMTVENLSTIFSPTLFCTGSVPTLPHQQHQLLHFLIVTPTIVGAGVKRPGPCSLAPTPNTTHPLTALVDAHPHNHTQA